MPLWFVIAAIMARRRTPFLCLRPAIRPLFSEDMISLTVLCKSVRIWMCDPSGAYFNAIRIAYFSLVEIEGMPGVLPL